MKGVGEEAQRDQSVGKGHWRAILKRRVWGQVRKWPQDTVRHPKTPTPQRSRTDCLHLGPWPAVVTRSSTASSSGCPVSSAVISVVQPHAHHWVSDSSGAGHHRAGRARVMEGSLGRCAAPQSPGEQRRMEQYTAGAVSDSEGELQGLWGQQQLFHTSTMGMARHLPLPFDKPAIYSIEGCRPRSPATYFHVLLQASCKAGAQEGAGISQGPLPTALAPGRREMLFALA